VFVESTTTGVRIRLRVQPRAGRTEVAGTFGDALRIRIASPPVDGEANAELIRFLAKRLGLRRANLRLVAGETARTKVVEATGIDALSAIRLLLMEP
jgi:uncharacterized protein (TIGR00251 family)